MDRCITNDSWHRFIFIRNGGRKYENRMLRCSSERDRFFEKLNIYHYDLSLYEELLTHDNIVSAKDHDAVLLREIV